MRNAISALATSFLVVAAAHAEPMPVRIRGATQANEELSVDTLNTIMAFAPPGCNDVRGVEVRIIDADRIPSFASYRVDNPKTGYERWDVNFCGKFSRFMVIFVPDPSGGTFISIKYPYPKDAL